MATTNFCPLVEEIWPVPDAADVFRRLARRSHVVFLDSALRHPILGRYSFLAADPFDYFERPVDDADSLGELGRRLAHWQQHAAPVAGLPPFQGGAAGLWSYDLARPWERLPSPAADEFQAPALAIGFYDVLVALDHVEDRAWIVSQGLPELEPRRRGRRAAERLRQMRDWLAAKPPANSGEAWPARLPPLGREDLATQYPVPGPHGLTSNFSESSYLRAVERVIDYIYAGDVFQVNLAQRLLLPAADDPAALYLRLRQRNPAPFAGYFDLGDFQVISASPERFLSVRQREVEARPIKGTRRFSGIDAGRSSADALCRSEKDRAENVMIVDLLRNDLSRVCQPQSVQVTQLCRVETYPFVQHLVSVIRGRLRESCGPIELLRAAFPGGSITGAPKVRAMEIIAELEPTARGPYCGSLGYLGFDGAMDLNILIRTITAGRGWWQAPVGGGIVAQSDPREEYEETWTKADGLLRSLSP